MVDDDVEDLAAALPRLTRVKLLEPCRLNSCKTTISSLLSLSIHCLGLKVLETHFNTRTIASDMQRLFDGGFGHDKPKCKVWNLCVGNVPLDVHEVDVGAIAMGLKRIFPCLKTCGGREQWVSVRAALSALDQ